MTQRQHDDEGRCDECDPFGDSSRCVCEPACSRRYVSDPDTAEDPCEVCGRDQRKHEEPLGDFENGYACDLDAPTREWHERANANPLNMNLFLRCRYGQPFVATFEHGMKRSIERLTTIEDIAMRDRPMLTMLKRTTWVTPEQLIETYPEPIRADANGYVSGVQPDGRWNFIHKHKGNRATRRRMAAQKRRRA